MRARGFDLALSRTERGYAATRPPREPRLLDEQFDMFLKQVSRLWYWNRYRCTAVLMVRYRCEVIAVLTALTETQYEVAVLLAWYWARCQSTENDGGPVRGGQYALRGLY